MPSLIKVTTPKGYSHSIEYVNPRFIVSTGRHNPATGERCNVRRSYCTDVRGMVYAVNLSLDLLNQKVEHA